jgi:hypothetical protein
MSRYMRFCSRKRRTLSWFTASSMGVSISRGISNLMHAERFGWTGQRNNYEPLHADLLI